MLPSCTICSSRLSSPWAVSVWVAADVPAASLLAMCITFEEICARASPGHWLSYSVRALLRCRFLCRAGLGACCARCGGCVRGRCRARVAGLRLALHLLQFFAALDDAVEHRVEFIVAVELGEQIAQLLARFEQLRETRHLVDEVLGMEVFELAEVQFDF